MPSSIQVHQGASDNPASAANNSVEQLQPSWCSRSTPLVQPLQWKLQLLGHVRHRLPGPAFLLASCDSLVLDTPLLVALGLLCPWWYHNTQQWPRKCYVVQTNPHSWIGFACSCAVREHPFAWPQLVCWMMPSCGIVVQSCYELWLLCLVQLAQEGLPNGPRQPCQERSLTWPGLILGVNRLSNISAFLDTPWSYWNSCKLTLVHCPQSNLWLMNDFFNFTLLMVLQSDLVEQNVRFQTGQWSVFLFVSLSLCTECLLAGFCSTIPFKFQRK